MREEMATSAGFATHVDGWVRNAVVSGSRSFGSLVCALPGVFPAEVVESLWRLRSSGEINQRIAERILAESARQPSPANASALGPTLPVPHPLDFEWRFAGIAASRLLNECKKRITGCEAVVLLGASSLIPKAQRRDDTFRLAVLDSNAQMIEFLINRFPAVSALLCDILRDELPLFGTAGVVVSDPPWYPEHQGTFMWACAQFCKVGGYILVSLPPIGTRPGIELERAALFRWAATLGLELVSLEAGALPYVTPLFERNTLASIGIRDIPSEWRRGDLAIFSRVLAAPVRRPDHRSIAERWLEATIGQVRIRLRADDPHMFNDPELQSLVDGNILPTVSRRDPRRSTADVWTSGNRIFGCRSTGILHSVIRAVGQGDAPDIVVADRLGRRLDAVEIRQINKASQQIVELLEVEQNEHSSYIEEDLEFASKAVAI